MPPDGPVTPPPKLDDVDFLPAAEETFLDEDWDLDTATTLDTDALTAVPDLDDDVTFTVGAQESGDEVAILRVGTFKLTNGAVLTVRGARPLVILAEEEIVLDGRLEAGGNRDVPGPGGGKGGTGSGAGKSAIHDDGTGSTYDDSGGGGGSFSTAGAAGGRAGKFLGGAAGDVFELTKLSGGGSGGTAGKCLNPPGGGGGAVLLYAKKRIRINAGGAINVGGGGGAGGVMNCMVGAGPGAGGGSGGAIWLQTAALEGDGLLTANGGGGGGGAYGGQSNGGTGANGLSSATVFAAGGTKAGPNETTAGGNGAVARTAASPVPTLNRGNAGGGGGGLGRIVVRAAAVSTNLRTSPAITPAP